MLNSLVYDVVIWMLFNQMVKGYQLFVWVIIGGIGLFVQMVKLGSEFWQVLSVCKFYDCGYECIVVIWLEKSKQMFGVYLVVDEKIDQERLIWFNVSDVLFIDGKIVLFVVFSGSFDNYLDVFNYQ